MTSTPASGRNVPTLRSQLLSVRTFMRGPLGVDDDEDERADCCGAEEQRSVLVDLAGLHRRRALPVPRAAAPLPLTAPSTTRWSMLR